MIGFYGLTAGMRTATRGWAPDKAMIEFMLGYK